MKKVVRDLVALWEAGYTALSKRRTCKSALIGEGFHLSHIQFSKSIKKANAE
jgi:hypothetical protein